LGNQVKRVGVGFSFAVVGLVTTWFSCWLGSRMSFRLPVHFLGNSGGCYEIGPCSLPWWASAMLFAMLFGPTFVFAVVGWFTGRSPALVRTVVLRLGALIPLTACFYLFSYAARP
jgi:hypothetical protein